MVLGLASTFVIKEILLRTDGSIHRNPVLLTAPTGQHCLLLLWQYNNGVAAACDSLTVSISQYLPKLCECTLNLTCHSMYDTGGQPNYL